MDKKCPRCGGRLLVFDSLKICPHCHAGIIAGISRTVDKVYSEEKFDAAKSAEIKSAEIIAGIINVISGTVDKVYGEERFGAAQGHGFAAERANDLYDNVTGKNSRIVGDDNKKNGADRMLNGVNIQSKYCSTGSDCVRACFENGKFRYYNSDGSPMQIEVPADKYEDAVKAMQSRIDRGQIRGVKKAEDVIRKGNVTYEQAKNIAKAGTIESLTYDAIDGIKIARNAGGISAAINFAVCIWNGESFEVALENSVKAGLQVGGIAWAGSILAGQMTKAGLTRAFIPMSDEIARGMLGLEGSAMKSASKLLRGNAITGMATVAIMSAGDVIDIFRGRISASQLFKNVVNTSAGVAGGLGGAMLGASLGPVGMLIAGWLASETARGVSQAVTDEFIEDDAKEMTRILEGTFQDVAFNFILNESESKTVADKLSKNLDGSTLKDMYAADNRQKFAYNLIENIAESVVKNRKKILLPSTEQYIGGLKKVLN